MTSSRKLPSIFPYSDQMLVELRSYTQLRSKSFIPNPRPETGFKNIRFGFLNCYIYLNIISGCEGPPGKTGERGEHILICTVSRRIHQSSLEKKLKLICYNQNKRRDCSCCLFLCCSTAIRIFLFYSMIFVDNNFL